MKRNLLVEGETAGQGAKRRVWWGKGGRQCDRAPTCVVRRLLLSCCRLLFSCHIVNIDMLEKKTADEAKIITVRYKESEQKFSLSIMREKYRNESNKQNLR